MLQNEKRWNLIIQELTIYWYRLIYQKEFLFNLHQTLKNFKFIWVEFPEREMWNHTVHTARASIMVKHQKCNFVSEEIRTKVNLSLYGNLIYLSPDTCKLFPVIYQTNLKSPQTTPLNYHTLKWIHILPSFPAAISIHKIWKLYRSFINNLRLGKFRGNLSGIGQYSTVSMFTHIMKYSICWKSSYSILYSTYISGKHVGLFVTNWSNGLDFSSKGIHI